MIFKHGLTLLAVAALFAVVATKQDAKAKLLDLLARASGSKCFAEFRNTTTIAIQQSEERHKECVTTCEDKKTAIRAQNKLIFNELLSRALQDFTAMAQCNNTREADEQLACLETTSLASSKQSFVIHTNCTRTLVNSKQAMIEAEHKKYNCTDDNQNQLEKELDLSAFILSECMKHDNDYKY